MTLCRIAVLIGFLLVEATAVTLSLNPISPSDSAAFSAVTSGSHESHLPTLPVLAKQTTRSPFHARFEQTETIIEGDTFYYSSVPAPLKRTETQSFVILFDFDSHTINAGSEKILDSVATIAKHGQQIRIFATGHTDMSGPKSYNQKLSRQRLSTVHQAFIDRGITPELIDQEAFGEKRPRVATPDGAPDSRNRRVEIIIGPAPEI